MAQFGQNQTLATLVKMLLQLKFIRSTIAGESLIVRSSRLDHTSMKIHPPLLHLSLVFPLALSVALPVLATTMQESSSTCSSQLEIPMQKEPVGLFMVRLTVNGTEGRFLVDSGANRNTLDVTEGKRFHPKVTTYENAPPGWGLTTMTVASDAVSLGNEEFGVMNLDFINSAVKKNGGEPYAGQLGATFFINHMAKIDFAKQVVCVTVSSTLTDAKH